MKATRALKALAERLLGVTIIRTRDMPRGTRVGWDIARALPAFRADVVFDVGANNGQSVERLGACFPEARFYCFEPAEQTFRELTDAVAGQARIQCHRIAMGASRGAGQLSHGRSSDLARLTTDVSTPVAGPSGPGTTEPVEIQTIDGFCDLARIANISYLKIDTEGHDLEVLKGADAMLSGQRVDVVEVEAGMNPENTLHVPFETLKRHLEDRHYRLFAIYEQAHEWKEQAPQLRRTNPVFISHRLIAANTSNGSVGRTP